MRNFIREYQDTILEIFENTDISEIVFFELIRFQKITI